MFVPRTVSVPKKKSAREGRSSFKQPQKINLSDDTSNTATHSSFRNVELNPAVQYYSEDSTRKNEKEVKGHSDEDDDEEEIVQLSKNQRWPKAGEPVCVICNRYGAYICDKTENDVCSIECKQKNMKISNEKGVNIHNSQDAGSAFVGHGPQEKYEVDSDHQKSEDLDSGNDMDHAAFATYFDANYTYKYHPTVQRFTEENINCLRDKLEIKIQGEDLILPGLEFSHFLLPSTLLDNLDKNDYVNPTPIQMQAIPIGLSGRDLLACAQTGTGKSAAFLIPLITRIFSTIDKLPESHKCCHIPLALILGPTRELCMQIEEQAKRFCKGLRNMKTALVVGGNPLPQQLHRLEQGIQILIATPGRLNEVLEKHGKSCDLKYVQILVLDEVDTMLQLGFQAQVDRIIQNIPQSSQKMMFSATIPPSIEKIASNILSRPIFVSVGPPSTPNRMVKQIILWVEEKSKKKRLFDLVNDKRHFLPPVLIFVDSKIGADMLADALNKVCGISCASLHGDKSQAIRNQVLKDFQNGSYQALVSTPVLGRGIDLLNVLMVVNFDMPATVNEYIHQVGRAGKLNKSGFAISFINNSNKDIFRSLFELCKTSNMKLPAEVTNSPYLQQQLEKQLRKGNKRKKDIVTTGNLMDLLKEYKEKRRK